MAQFNFERLVAWQYSKKLTKDVYLLTASFPVSELYALTNQVRRAVVSIGSNIAEGAGRPAVKEQIHFYEIAYGSLMEVMCQMIFATELGYISPEELASVRQSIEELARMISGLKNSRLQALNSKNSKLK